LDITDITSPLIRYSLYPILTPAKKLIIICGQINYS